jgi:chemotaxis protein MotA
MPTVIGLVVVIGSVLGGFAMGGGPFPVLIQPNELLVIGGAALGTILVAAPGKLKGQILHSFLSAFKMDVPSKEDYIELLKLQFEIFMFTRRNGVVALEQHLTDMGASEIFKKYPTFLRRHEAAEFFKDALNQVVNGTGPEDLEQLLEAELETHHEESHIPVTLLKTTGDALPGLGIVAAVLGIVITMAHLDGGPEEIGHHVGAALVGTFLGILLCYGLMQPIATNVELQELSNSKYLRCIKDGLMASVRGAAPPFAVEFARKAIFSSDRPSFEETEKACAEVKAGAAA